MDPVALLKGMEELAPESVGMDLEVEEASPLQIHIHGIYSINARDLLELCDNNGVSACLKVAPNETITVVFFPEAASAEPAEKDAADFEVFKSMAISSDKVYGT